MPPQTSGGLLAAIARLHIAPNRGSLKLQNLDRSVARRQIDQRPSAPDRTFQVMISPVVSVPQFAEIGGYVSVRRVGSHARVRKRRQPNDDGGIAGGCPEFGQLSALESKLDVTIRGLRLHRPILVRIG